MIYLTTGANGAGKTLLTLKAVREQQLKENRPVYYHGFDMNLVKAEEFGWQEFDPKKWQELPDGSICVMDECQNEFPLRRSGAEIPEYVNAIAQFRRKRGFDFWMIAPHPSLIDVFVRRLIDKPSWHRHLKRTFGADVVSELKFSSPDLKCEQPGAGERAEVKMLPYPKEVYSWYSSASLHTGKRHIPKQVYVIFASFLLVPALLYYAYNSVFGGAQEKSKVNQPLKQDAKPVVAAAIAPVAPSRKRDAPEYFDSFMPRIADFPHSAPRYDDVTKAVVAPFPAACISMKDRCDCFTQQGTLMVVSKDMCLQIVAKGFFVDWQQPQDSQAQESRSRAAGRADPALPQLVAQEVPRYVPPPAAMPAQGASLDAADPAGHQSNAYLQGLAARNAQVRSGMR